MGKSFLNIVLVEPGSGGDATEQLFVIAGLKCVHQLICDIDFAVVSPSHHNRMVAVHVQFAITYVFCRVEMTR